MLRVLQQIKTGNGIRYLSGFNNGTMSKDHLSNEPMDHPMDIGMFHFLKNTYTVTGLSIAASLGTAQLLDYLSVSLAAPIGITLGGFAASLAGIYAFSKIPHNIKTDEHGYKYSDNPLSRKLAYSSVILGTGVMLSPFVSLISASSPMILPAATLLSLSTMGGASLYAYRAKPDSLLPWKSALFGGLTGLIAVGISSIVCSLVLGNNALLTTMLTNVDIYGGLLLFTGLTAYDTQKAMHMYKSGNPDHYGCSLSLFMDFTNMVIRFMEILAKIKKN